MYTATKNQAFTVIELLIILIIFGILVGIIIPVLATAKNKAQQIACASNLRQLYIAFEEYITDNNGLLPRPNNSDTSKDGTKICIAEVWCKATDNYLIVSQLPSKRDSISPEERLLRVKQYPTFTTVSFSKQDTTRTIKMNQNIAPSSECQRSIDAIENTTKIVLLFDGRINNNGVADTYEGSYGSIAQRHPKAANILFMDGHVARIQNGNSDGTTNEGWQNGQAGQGLIWDPNNPNLP